MINQLKNELQKQANSEQAKILQRFFKTGVGEYGEGDIFLGIKVPIQRKIAKKYLDISLQHLQEMLNSNVHEYRFIALVILMNKYDKSREEIFDFYNKNLGGVNNWDLVDISCPNIIGEYLLYKDDRSILYNYANSNELWKKRISIISTLKFIKNNQFGDTLKISEILLNDKHDLIHKAVGWMLREVGKMNQKVEEEFLDKYYKQMPRTMLRYSIERFDKEKKEYYMKK